MNFCKTISRWLLACCLLLSAVPPAQAGTKAVDTEVKVPGGNLISVSRSNITGKSSLLWLPSEYGLTRGDKKVIDELSREGVDVWSADLLNSYFLIPAASSIEKIPAEDITSLLNHFSAEDKKQKIILASGRTAVILLRALKNSKRPDGIILISPNFYLATPEPGTSATYLPVTSQTSQKIHILQPQLSPWYWQVERQTEVLQSGGSKVTVHVLAGVRDRFYFRPDAMESEKKFQQKLAKKILDTINMVNKKTD